MVGTASDLAGDAPEERFPSTTQGGWQRDVWELRTCRKEEEDKAASLSAGSAAVCRQKD